MNKLIHLPGPEIKNRALPKVKHLASQVESASHRFSTAKISERAAVFNVFSHDRYNRYGKPYNSATRCISSDPVVTENTLNTAILLSGYAHAIGHAFDFEVISRQTNDDHVKFIRGEAGDSWLPIMSDIFGMSGSSK